jgi:hypothetical protein
MNIERLGNRLLETKGIEQVFYFGAKVHDNIEPYFSLNYQTPTREESTSLLINPDHAHWLLNGFGLTPINGRDYIKIYYGAKRYDYLHRLVMPCNRGEIVHHRYIDQTTWNRREDLLVIDRGCHTSLHINLSNEIKRAAKLNNLQT